MIEAFAPELLTQARAAQTPEALLALAAEHGVTLPPEEVKTRFDLFQQVVVLAGEYGGSYNEAGQPKVHRDTVCGGPYQCKYCAYSYRTYYDRDRSVHGCNGEFRKFTCDSCVSFISQGEFGYCCNPKMQKKLEKM